MNINYFSLSQIIQIMYIVAIFISYGLHCFVLIHVIWKHYLREKYANAPLYENILKIVCVIFTCKC